MIPTNYAEIDALYRAILADGAKCIAVTAAGAGEGTTTTAYAIARRISRAGCKVLLVDLNVHGSSLGAFLGIERIEWSPDDMELEEKLTDFGTDGMSALAAPLEGALSPGFREPDVLRAFFERMAETFDFIVIDTAPVLARNARNVPPLAVCRAAGAVLVSVMARKTVQPALTQAVDLVRNEGARLIGAAMNDRDNPSLGEELEREAGRLSCIAPWAVRWLTFGLRRVSLLYERP